MNDNEMILSRIAGVPASEEPNPEAVMAEAMFSKSVSRKRNPDEPVPSGFAMLAAEAMRGLREKGFVVKLEQTSAASDPNVVPVNLPFQRVPQTASDSGTECQIKPFSRR